VSVQYIRDTYGVPVKRGGLVRPVSGRLKGQPLIIKSCSHHVHAHDSRTRHTYRFHPRDLEYWTEADGWVSGARMKE